MQTNSRSRIFTNNPKPVSDYGLIKQGVGLPKTDIWTYDKNQKKIKYNRIKKDQEQRRVRHVYLVPIMLASNKQN